MYDIKIYLDLLSCGADLGQDIAELSETDAKQMLCSTIRYLQDRGADPNDLVQFEQEQRFRP